MKDRTALEGHAASRNPIIGLTEVEPGLAPGGRLLRDSATLAVGQAVVLAAGAVTSLLAARWLGAGAKGELTLAFAVPALLAPLAAGGVDSYIATRSSSEDQAHQSSAIQFGIHAARWGGAIVGSITLAYGLLTELSVALVFFAAAAAVLRPTLAVLQAVLTTGDRVVRVGQCLLAMALTHVLAVVLLGLDGASILDFALGASLAVLVGWGCSSPVAARRRAGGAKPLVRAERRKMLRFGSTVVLGDALQLANYRMDLFILAAFVPLSDIGVYAVAVSLAEMLWQLPNAVSRSILPRIMAGQLQRSGVNRISFGLGVLAAGLALIGWFLVVELVEPLFGSGFQRVPSILAVLLPGVVLIGATKPLAAWTLSCGFPNRNLMASAAGFGVVLVGNLLLVPRLGILGAALASTLAYTVAAAIVTLMARGAEYSSLRPPTETT